MEPARELPTDLGLRAIRVKIVMVPFPQHQLELRVVDVVWHVSCVLELFQSAAAKGVPGDAVKILAECYKSCWRLIRVIFCPEDLREAQESG